MNNKTKQIQIPIPLNQNIHQYLLQSGNSITFKYGFLLIHNTNFKYKWKSICQRYLSNNHQLFLCLQTQSQLDKQINWYQKWHGQKYVNHQIQYQGKFNYFYKQGQGVEIKYDQDTSQIIQKYKGTFSCDLRHGNKQILIQKLGDKQFIYEGRWEKGARQGKFTCCDSKKQGFKRICYFINDINKESQENNRHKTELKPSLPDFPLRYGMQATQGIINSLSQKQWLQSTAVDFFFKHLEQSFKYKQNKVRDVKVFGTAFFQRLITSSLVETNNKIRIQNIKHIQNIYSQVTSIFQMYPLILMPLNKDRSHFSLAAIKTKINRDKTNQLISVSFDLIHMDPLGYQTPFVHEHLKSLIVTEISQRIHKDQKYQYFQGLKNANILTTKSFNCSLQNNDYDCGPFTCIYGFLHLHSVGFQKQVDWKFKRAKIDALRKLIKKDVFYELKNFYDLCCQILL